MPLFKSLRSKSRKSSFSSEAGPNHNGTKAGAGLFGRGEDDAASMIAGPTNTFGSPLQSRLASSTGRVPVGSPIREDPSALPTAGRSSLGPTSPSLGTSGGDRKKNGGFFGRSNSRRDLGGSVPQRTLSYGQLLDGEGAASTPSAAVAAPSPQYETAPALNSFSNAQAEATAEAANQPPGGARPSDLFAGKGLAWGDLELSPGGGSAPKAPQQTDDLSNFLKARRQWVPTFATGEDGKEAVDVKPISKPADIAFSALPAASNLMNLSDLDASHKRKQHLLGPDFESATLLAASANPSTGIPIGIGPSHSALPPAASAQTSSPSKAAATNSSLATPIVNTGRSSPARKPVPVPTVASFAHDTEDNVVETPSGSPMKSVRTKGRGGGARGGDDSAEHSQMATISSSEGAAPAPADAVSTLSQGISSAQIVDPASKVAGDHQQSTLGAVVDQAAPLPQSGKAGESQSSGAAGAGAGANSNGHNGASPALNLNGGSSLAGGPPSQQQELDQDSTQDERVLTKGQDALNDAASTIPVHPSYRKTEAGASVPEIPGGIK